MLIHSAPSLFVSLLIAVFAGDYIISAISTRWRDKIINDQQYSKDEKVQHHAYAEISRQIGMTERALYVIALYISHPEFVAAWLVFKVATRWRAWDTTSTPVSLVETKEKETISEEDKKTLERARFNLFVLGNALSILVSVGTVLIVKTIFALGF